MEWSHWSRHLWRNDDWKSILRHPGTAHRPIFLSQSNDALSAWRGLFTLRSKIQTNSWLKVNWSMAGSSSTDWMASQESGLDPLRLLVLALLKVLGVQEQPTLRNSPIPSNRYPREYQWNSFENVPWHDERFWEACSSVSWFRWQCFWMVSYVFLIVFIDLTIALYFKISWAVSDIFFEWTYWITNTKGSFSLLFSILY